MIILSLQILKHLILLILSGSSSAFFISSFLFRTSSSSVVNCWSFSQLFLSNNLKFLTQMIRSFSSLFMSLLSLYYVSFFSAKDSNALLDFLGIFATSWSFFSPSMTFYCSYVFSASSNFSIISSNASSRKLFSGKIPEAAVLLFLLYVEE